MSKAKEFNEAKPLWKPNRILQQLQIAIDFERNDKIGFSHFIPFIVSILI